MILFSSLINFAFGDRINSTFPFCLVFSLRSLFPRFHRFCVLIFNFINFWHEKCQSYRELNLQTLYQLIHIYNHTSWMQSNFILFSSASLDSAPAAENTLPLADSTEHCGALQYFLTPVGEGSCGEPK